MNIQLNCPNCNHENNLNSKKAKKITPVKCKKCDKSFNAHFTEKDLKHFNIMSNSTENIMGDIKITF